MIKVYYTQEQIDRANAVDLAEFLRGQGEKLKSCGKEAAWEAHDSLKIRGNKWYRFSNGTGGYPVDFVMEFCGKSFQEAVELLTGEKGKGQIETAPAPSPEFRLPARNITNATARQYLVKDRGINESLVDYFLAVGDIYEDAGHHNAVFVGRDEKNLPRFAHCRGTSREFRKDVAGSDKSYGFRFRGTGDKVYVFEAPIDLLSFINLFSKGWQEQSYLSLSGVAYKALWRFLRESREISAVFLCLDNDKAGEEACARLNREIPEGLRVYRMRPGAKDWNDLLRQRNSIERGRWYVLEDLRKESGGEETVRMIRLSDVEEREVSFLWKPYIPFGKLTILHGDAGNGKTYLAIQICAACTNRIPVPNMEETEPFNVIYQTAEDGLGDTIRPRLIAAGADLDRVLVIDEGEGDPLTLTDERIEKAIVQNDARLLIIDPLQAFLGVRVDMNRANEIRPILRKIGNVAQRTGCAIVLIGHLNKATGQQSCYRGLGTIDFNAGVRSVLVIGKTKDDPNLRVLVHDKSSLAPPGPSVAFILGDEEGFRWVGDYDISADELLSGTEKKRESKTKEAKDMICEMLAGGREVFSEEIDREAVARGISTRTVREAKKELGEYLRSRTGEGHKKIFWMV